MGTKSKMRILFSVLALATLIEARRRHRVAKFVPESQNEANEGGVEAKSREGRLFSPFYIVTFKNDPCRSDSTITGGATGSTLRNGTCYTSSQCTSNGGTASGGCAAGFGVCCLFTVSTSGGNIVQNCTYIQNPGFPSALTTTTTVMYTINKCQADVCLLRLDFESFTILGTGNTEELNAALTTTGGSCLDSLTVAATGSGQNIPEICGQNTGQHIYVDIGTGNTNSATLSFAFMGASTTRTWEIKVTQLKCQTPGHPTDNSCLQYHTDLTGRLTTFNFIPTDDNHLRNQEYSICIRQAAGFCCVEYTLCSDMLSNTLNTIAAAPVVHDSLCTADYFGVSGAMTTCVTNIAGRQLGRFCGTVLSGDATATMDSPICDCQAPFRVDIFTDGLDDTATAGTPTANTAQSRGLCLNYRQIPC